MNKKSMTVKQVSRLTGVTVRALHHYDEIGLLKPKNFSESGYRLYGDEDLELLQQILFLKELDFSLKEIAGLINRPDYKKSEALKNQRQLLILKKQRLDSLINLIDSILKGEKSMSFKEFDMGEIENHRKKYAKETIEKYGETDAYKQSLQKTSKYTEKDWQQIKSEADSIYAEFVKLMKEEGSKEQKDAAVKSWQAHITKYYYDCADQMMLGLADLYVSDPRFTKNIDKYEKGLAEYMSIAIKDCFND